MSRSLSCAICGAGFVSSHSQAKYCSPECAKEGERESWRKYGAKNRKRRQIYHRKHYEKFRDKVAERIKVYRATPRGKESQRATGMRQREKFPEKYAARQAVKVAMMRGDLVRGTCVECGKDQAEAHHPDYSKPLVVVWLCQAHHRALHKRLKGEG